MWRKKIKKRKMQYLLIMLILCLATAIFTGCISFAWEIQNHVDGYYDSANCPIYFTVLTNDNGKELIEQSEQASQLLSRIDTGNAVLDMNDCYANGVKVKDNPMIIYELDDTASLHYPLPILEGKEAKAPKDNEIWLCKVYADAVDLNVGDELLFGSDSTKQYMVSAIVNTPECSSGFLDNYPCYMNSETLRSIEGVRGFSVEMYAKSNEITIKQVMDALPQEFSDEMIYSIERDTLELCLSMLAAIFGGVGTAAAIVIFAVSIIIVRYLVRATIVKEYKMIGVYKTLGKNSREIQNIYLISYLVTGMTGVLLGVLIGRPLSVYLSTLVLGGNLSIVLTNRTLFVSIAAVLVMGIMLFLNIWFELRKISKITPILALGAGAVSSKEKITKSLIPNASSSFAMAINGMMKNKRTTILVITILSVCFYINLLACSVGLTLGNYAKDKRIWENLPDYDGYLSDAKEDVISYLQQSPDVNDFVPFNLSLEGIKMEFEDCSLTLNTANPMIYENFTKERYQSVPFTKGRICVNPHEITCSEKFLKEAGKSVGEYLKIKVENQEQSFLIAGSYSAMMKGGTSFYMRYDDLKDLGADVAMDKIFFFLRKGVSYDDFAKDLKDKFPDVKITKDFAFIDQEAETVNSIANPICILIIGSFLAFAILNMINLVYTETSEKRKKYGILKAIGFKSGYIQRENILRFTLEAAVAVVITIVLHEVLSPVIFSLACGIVYISKPAWLTVAACSSMYIILLAIVYSLLIVIKKISPVELMEE